MNPDTGNLKPYSELLEEFGDDETIAEAGYKKVPKHLEASARRLLDWAKKRREDQLKEKKTNRKKKSRRRQKQQSKRRNR